MKKLFALFFLMTSSAQASYIFRNSASNINSGTLPNARLDAASVTLQGNNFAIPLSQVAAQINQLTTDTTTINQKIYPPVARTYDLYVGTAGTPNIDVTVGGSASFDALFASITSRGLTYASSGTFRVFMVNGLYQISNATIPAGVYIYCGSSVVFTPTDTTSSIFTVYGKLIGPRFDLQNRAYAGPMVQIKGNGSVEDIRGVDNTASISQLAGVNMTMFLIQNSTFAKVTGRIDGYAGAQQDVAHGGLVTLIRSSDCYVNLDVRGASLASAGKHTFYVSEGDRNTIDGTYEGVGARMFYIGGGNRGLQIKGRYHITQQYDGAGFIYIRSLDPPIETTTGTVISATFIHDVGSAQPLIQIQGDNNVKGTLITNCNAWTTQGTANAPTSFVKISDGGVRQTVIANNHVMGMPFISDSGIETIYTSLANTNNITKP